MFPNQRPSLLIVEKIDMDNLTKLSTKAINKVFFFFLNIFLDKKIENKVNKN